MRTMSDKRQRQWARISERRGSTLAEMLLVVAILIVLISIAFIGVIGWRRTLKQLEYDSAAKEIFVAAQNHLTLAESQGLLEETVKTGNTVKPAFARGTQIGGTDEFYFVYGTGSDSPTDKTSVFQLMLPFGSIDETIRTGGSYIIRYQPDAAIVLDVFYTEDAKLAKGNESTPSDFDSLISLTDEEGDKSARKNYVTKSGQKAIVGYYGGSAKGRASIKLKAPTVQVVNEDTLKVIVTYAQKNYDKLAKDDTRLTLVIEEVAFDEGETIVGAQRCIDLKGLAPKTVGENEVYDQIVLDDVTTAFGSLSMRSWDDTNGINFTPGRNLNIYVEAQGSSALALARSAQIETNGLFAKTASVAKDVITGAGTLKLEVTSFRHLANLSQAVSGFTGAGCRSIDAAQTTDLFWQSFKDNTGGDETAIYTTNVANVPQSGTFRPVDVSSGLVLAYDGLKQSGIAGAAPTAHKVSGVVIDAAGPAGIFANLGTEGSQIKNLEVVNASVASAGDAGALVGQMTTGTSVSNVLVRTTLKSGDISDHKVTASGSGAAGGLVGKVSGGTITACAAAVYVQAANGAAGGLAGSADGATTITQSYSGGHTVGSAAGAITYPADSLDVSSSGGAAGGLVGSFDGAAGASIEACYSTCSASGSVAGGLVGSSSNTAIKDCYVTGLVSGPEATTGAFVGSLAGTAPEASNSYYQMVNGKDIKAIGGSTEDTSVTPFDKSSHEDASLSVFGDFFVTDDASSKAVPYNVALGTLYRLDGKAIYPLKTIERLSGLADDTSAYQQHLTHHFGDWPSYEVLIINK